MLESVTSTVSSAAALRAAPARSGTAQLGEASPTDFSQSVAQRTGIPFISPFVVFDNNFDEAIIQIRDSATGDVVNQFPSEQTLARRQIEEQRAAQRAEAESSVNQTTATAPAFQGEDIRVDNGTAVEAQRIASDIDVTVPQAPNVSFEGASQALVSAQQTGQTTTPQQVSVDA